MNKARLKFISMMILALCKIKTVNYMALANVFDSESEAESSLRRIQRFMADFDLPMKLISCFIFNILPKKEDLVLVMDRTNWKFGHANINILMLGICYKTWPFQSCLKCWTKGAIRTPQKGLNWLSNLSAGSGQIV
ncbi:hypothetical protein [Chryseobacterium sp. SNU WT5]|uniref:hypothetical protein n=1 Tax=Chryseobacterium sp. SNU WT5 TaxID=2594269 RepID=UPI001E2CDDA7|nr:hypothetical protein [Chryseobacterium sp. SNU WT5]